MKFARFQRIVTAIVFATLCSLSSLADATTALFLSREELVRISDVIVRVKVGKATHGESEDKRALLTNTVLEVTQYLKGTGSSHLVVQQFGGKYNGKIQKVMGDGRLATGEDAIVFLKRGENGRVYLSVLSQSVYHVDDKGMARRNLEGLVLMKKSGDSIQPIKVVEHAETVESLMTDIRRLASAH